ncbi:MAG TPA: sialate O-acetylesterase [Opitutaceae bacterium]|nr:sialate O-acetylesterase [Opitutaceae bacterium]
MTTINATSTSKAEVRATLRNLAAGLLGLLAGGMSASDASSDADFAVPADAGAFHIFLLAGQSNMAGRGEVGPQDTAPIPRVLALGKDGAWQPAVDPIHWDKSVAGVGLARSFAVAYLGEHPGVTIGFVPAACGGSPIATWTPGAYFDQTDSHPYDDAIRRTRVALERGTLKGILWHQGESDCHPGLSEVYAIALAELIARFRRELGVSDLPFVVGQLGRFEGAPWGEHTLRVDEAMRTVVASTPRSAFVSSEELTSKPDNIHFNSDSLREFGRRYYAAFRKMEQK